MKQRELTDGINRPLIILSKCPVCNGEYTATVFNDGHLECSSCDVYWVDFTAHLGSPIMERPPGHEYFYSKLIE